MVLNLGCIVEGDGDVKAVPLLARRIGSELDPAIDLRIRPLWRIGRGKLVRAGGLEQAVEQVARRLVAPRAILVLIDADTDCPAELGPTLLERAKIARPDVRMGLVLAKHEYEAWFLASIESLRGRRDISEDAAMVANPDAVRDAKGRLTRLMAGTRAYGATRDQPALTEIFDMQLARQRSDSFDKCWREVRRLLAEASGEPAREGPQPA